MDQYKQIAVVLFVACLLAVSWGIFKPEPVQQVFLQSDKVAHLGAFFCLAITGRVAMLSVNAYYYWITMLLLAFLMEYAQGVLQVNRVFSYYDALANGLGVLCALVFYFIIVRFKSYKAEQL